MGGGGVVRAAAKAAGVGYSPSIFRHLPTVPLSEQVAATATARRCPPQVPALSSAGDTISSTNPWIDSSTAVQRPLWDDWDFAGDVEVQQLDSMNPPSRVVFGAAPTMEEAREATMDLKDALEMVYFSSPIVSGPEGSSTDALSMRNPETKACITSEIAAVFPSVPKHALDAFHLLKENPEVQNVIASLAADKNVWDAVMKNDQVMNFYKSQEAAGGLPAAHLDEDMDSWSAKEGHSSDGQTSETPGNGFTRFFNNIKMQVTSMVSNLSEFFQNVFGNSAEESSSGDIKRASAEFAGKAIGGVSFVALAILAILVVLLKRK